jgi:hypothetical protein
MKFKRKIAGFLAFVFALSAFAVFPVGATPPDRFADAAAVVAFINGLTAVNAPTPGFNNVEEFTTWLQTNVVPEVVGTATGYAWPARTVVDAWVNSQISADRPNYAAARTAISNAIWAYMQSALPTNQGAPAIAASHFTGLPAFPGITSASPFRWATEAEVRTYVNSVLGGIAGWTGEATNVVARAIYQAFPATAPTSANVSPGIRANAPSLMTLNLSNVMSIEFPGVPIDATGEWTDINALVTAVNGAAALESSTGEAPQWNNIDTLVIAINGETDLNSVSAARRFVWNVPANDDPLWPAGVNTEAKNDVRSAIGDTGDFPVPSNFDSVLFGDSPFGIMNLFEQTAGLGGGMTSFQLPLAQNGTGGTAAQGFLGALSPAINLTAERLTALNAFITAINAGSVTGVTAPASAAGVTITAGNLPAAVNINDSFYVGQVGETDVIPPPPLPADILSLNIFRNQTTESVQGTVIANGTISQGAAALIVPNFRLNASITAGINFMELNLEGTGWSGWNGAGAISGSNLGAWNALAARTGFELQASGQIRFNGIWADNNGTNMVIGKPATPASGSGWLAVPYTITFDTTPGRELTLMITWDPAETAVGEALNGSFLWLPLHYHTGTGDDEIVFGANSFTQLVGRRLPILPTAQGLQITFGTSSAPHPQNAPMRSIEILERNAGALVNNTAGASFGQVVAARSRIRVELPQDWVFANQQFIRFGWGVGVNFAGAHNGFLPVDSTSALLTDGTYASGYVFPNAAAAAAAQAVDGSGSQHIAWLTTPDAWTGRQELVIQFSETLTGTRLAGIPVRFTIASDTLEPARRPVVTHRFVQFPMNDTEVEATVRIGNAAQSNTPVTGTGVIARFGQAGLTLSVPATPAAVLAGRLYGVMPNRTNNQTIPRNTINASGALVANAPPTWNQVANVNVLNNPTAWGNLFTAGTTNGWLASTGVIRLEENMPMSVPGFTSFTFTLVDAAGNVIPEAKIAAFAINTDQRANPQTFGRTTIHGISGVWQNRVGANTHNVTPRHNGTLIANFNSFGNAEISPGITGNAALVFSNDGHSVTVSGIEVDNSGLRQMAMDMRFWISTAPSFGGEVYINVSTPNTINTGWDITVDINGNLAQIANVTRLFSVEAARTPVNMGFSRVPVAPVTVTELRQAGDLRQNGTLELALSENVTVAPWASGINFWPITNSNVSTNENVHNNNRMLATPVGGTISGRLEIVIERPSREVASFVTVSGLETRVDRAMPFADVDLIARGDAVLNNDHFVLNAVGTIGVGIGAGGILTDTRMLSPLEEGFRRYGHTGIVVENYIDSITPGAGAGNTAVINRIAVPLAPGSGFTVNGLTRNFAGSVNFGSAANINTVNVPANRLYVPFRAIIEAIDPNATIVFHQGNMFMNIPHVIEVTIGSRTVIWTVGDHTYTINNGTPIPMMVGNDIIRPFVGNGTNGTVDNTTYLPIRFIADAFGLELIVTDSEVIINPAAADRQ